MTAYKQRKISNNWLDIELYFVGIRYRKDYLKSGIASDYGRNSFIARVPKEDMVLYQTERYDLQNFAYEIDLADDDQPSHAGVRVVARHSTGERSEPAGDHPPDLLTEVEEDGQLGAQLRDRGERRTRVGLRREELPHDADMRAGGDGEELGQALDEPEDDDLEDVLHVFLQYVRMRSARTRRPNSSASTGTRSSTPWNIPVKSRSDGSRNGANP